MQGLWKQENIEFENFFALVQNKAKENSKVFFLCNGEGKLATYDKYEMEDMTGWLISIELANQFEKEWLANKVKASKLNKWNHYIAYVDWKLIDGKVEITIME